LVVSRYTVVRLLECFFRRWWLFVLPVVLLVGAGVALVVVKKPVYRSVGTINVASTTLLSTLQDVRGDPGYGYDTPAAATSKQLNSQLSTDQFVRDVVARAKLDGLVAGGVLTMEGVRASITSWPAGSNLLNVVASSSDPEVAQRLASSTIDTFIQGVVDSNIGDSSAATGFFSNLLKTYQVDVDQARQALEAYFKSHPAPSFGRVRPDDEQAQLVRLNADVSKAQDRYNSVLSKSEDARLSTEQTKNDIGRRLRLVDPPQVPGAPQPRLRAAVLAVSLFLALGVLLSVAAVVVAAVLDHSFRSAGEIRDRLGLRVLAVVPDAGVVRLSLPSTSGLKGRAARHAKTPPLTTSGRRAG
jgi:capsular polysaccharide biosynthesis protein